MAEISEQREKYPLLSVIIPVYNAAPYLKKCIDSVINQTYRNLEILLIDDGSTDQSPTLCDGYAKADSRIKVVHKQNEGLVKARKTGVSLAAGEYITYVDADDWVDTDAYERIFNGRTETDADLILYGLVEEYEDISIEKDNLFAEGYYSEKEMKETLYPRMLCGSVFFRFGVLPNLVCKVVKREILVKVQQIIREDVTFGEDADCTYQMLLEAKGVQILRNTPYHYRKRRDSMVWERTAFSKVQNLYLDLKRAFERSGQREMLMPQLYQYMLFILLLKSAERFADCEVFAEHFAEKEIVLYGAGGFGQELYRVLTKQKISEVVLWVDQKYKTYQEMGLPVSPPKKIAYCEYDDIFIAVLDTQTCEKIAKDLTERGIHTGRIHYVTPTEEWIKAVYSILEEDRTE